MGHYIYAKYLKGQQVRQVQREEEKEIIARWSYFQPREEECGCSVSSYRLRVICLPQLCHPAVTHCDASLCASILAHPFLRLCACTPRLSALTGEDYECGNEQVCVIYAALTSTLWLLSLISHFSSAPTYHPFLFVCLSLNFYMMKLLWRQSWNLSAAISQRKPCASTRHQTNLHSPLPLSASLPSRIRASITQSVSPQTATLQPTTCDSQCGKIWLPRGCGGRRAKALGLANQPLIKGISID